MDTAPALPPPVAALLAAAFPGAPVAGLAPTVGGFSNLTLRARVGGVPCVLKAASHPAKVADLRREARALALLRGRRLGAPRALAFREGGGWALLVTGRRPGAPGLTLYGGPPEALAPACAALGQALSRLHAAPIAPPGDLGDLLVAGRAAATAKALGVLPLPPELRAPLAEALAHPAWRPARPRLVHGDAGLHNILWGRRGLTLLDWELAGWGDPRLDLAWAAWALRFRGAPPALWAALLDGYGPQRAAALGLADDALRALALGQIAALLVRASGLPAWDEWLRRARATLQLNQIAPG
ncbi:MAG TPA: phosphotransferase [Chloroflexaceae bacterium]|nr:phosphotransferase [Chloroflexaceae bacterium]